MSAVLPKSAHEIFAGLTTRQQQIVELMLESRPYKFIGSRLGISPMTVGSVAFLIFRKFKVSRRDELIDIFRNGRQVMVTRETLLKWASYAAIAEQLKVPGSASMSIELTELLQKNEVIKIFMIPPRAGDHAL